MNVGSLFTGIGGFDLGLERAGMRVVWQCESDPYRRAVLRKHWPDVPCFKDVLEVRGSDGVVAAEGRTGLSSVLKNDDGGPLDVICGGFPCQDTSAVGNRAGLGGSKSGLWVEFARVIRELRPRYIIVENVPGLLVRGMGRVLGDLADLRYDAEWDCLPAAHFGAPHLRLRTWLVAYPTLDGDRLSPLVFSTRRDQPKHSPWWDTEPGLARVADGIPHGVDRRSALGDALLPQIAEWIGRKLMAA